MFRNILQSKSHWMAICTDWLMYFLWDYLLCGIQSFSGAWESLGLWEHAFALVRGRNHALDAEFRKSGDTWDPAEILRKLELNAHDLQIRMDAWLLLELWCGQSVLPLDDSSMVIGTIDANLGLQIVLQDCGWAALAGFCVTWRLKAEKRLQPVTNAL